MKLKVPWLLMYSMNNIYCTSHGCKTTVRAVEWRDTGGVGYSDHNDIHTHSHSHKAILSHLFTLPLLHMHLQIELQVAHTGILHLFHSTRGLLGSDVSDGDQGSD